MTTEKKETAFQRRMREFRAVAEQLAADRARARQEQEKEAR